MTSSSIQWEHHARNIQSCLENAFTDASYTDVTLVTDDFQSFASHRLILSSLSETFHEILKMSSHSHPMIYLKGFKSSDVLNILNFIYKGQVQIPTKDLNDFVGKAQELKLLNIQKQFHKNEALEDRNQNSSISEKIDKEIDIEQKRMRNETLHENSQKDSIDFTAVDEGRNNYEAENELGEMMMTVQEVKAEADVELDKANEVENQIDLMLTGQSSKDPPPLDPSFDSVTKKTESQDIKPPNDESLIEDESILADVISNGNGEHLCPHSGCDYKVRKRWKELMRFHMTSTHGDFSKLKCIYESCHRFYSNKTNRNAHVRNYHKCDQCEEQYELNKDLKKHKKNVHPNPFLRFQML